MSKLSKLMVILVFLLSIAFAFLSMKAWALIEKQEGMIASLQKSVSGQGEVVDDLKQTGSSIKEKITSLKSTNQQLSDDLESAKQDKDQMEADLAQAKIDKQKIETELNEALTKVEPLDKQNQANLKRINDLIEAKNTVVKQLNADRKKLVEINNELVEVKSVIAAYPKLWQTMLSPERKEGDREADDGEITSIKPGDVTVVTFEGSAAINKDDAYNVLRGDQVVGKMVVGNVYRSVVVCKKKSGRIKEDLQVGDVLRLR
ncbi:hypothetical protein ACFLS1_01645 [Verrucomicrobiota bacterium]